MARSVWQEEYERAGGPPAMMKRTVKETLSLFHRAGRYFCSVNANTDSLPFC
ncbi:hypothetical protein CERZMDRAFT_90510 [Cercospora zeae-maydis SCOH1-5]|uniref:Uncharacterized protein n=1 Tax=Cercospora zeae-maydis SCOH1-5 TaxID=717836 RepID=A0A6A6FJX5_9PEZI|nr:hypothetical protein CERZMDRAFT_90510 [Cercospora zeae-maydis SCOH1-5]